MRSAGDRRIGGSPATDPAASDGSRAPDDRALVRAAQRGDRQAFGALVSRHARSILSLTTRMLGADEAEDVAQDVFVAAYRALPGFQRESAFSTWLYRIAVNRCRDVLRARRPPTVPLDDEETGAAAWEGPGVLTPERELEHAETASAIARGIEALPPLYRESFVLRHVEGLGYEEMSAILGVHRDTLKMRVYKARTLLAQALAHLHAAP